MASLRLGRRGGRAGFTIVEILVVIAIIAMLATVGIVQILRARIVTHEQLALVSLRQMMKACQFYNLLNQRFPDTLQDLGPAGSIPGYLDATLIGDGTTVTKEGYTFTYQSPNPPETFILLADPQTYGKTGVRHFLIDTSFQIHETFEDRAATAADPAIP